jgi:hypothetical protein
MLENQLITVAIKDINSYDAKQLKIFSNNKVIKVLPLSKGLTVQGKYSIKATVDKTKTSSNEPTNLTISIEGLGNIDDIEEFLLNLPDQVVYSSKPTITSGLQNGDYGGTFTQKISIISDKSFTIPSIQFKYFDKELKKEVDINTTSFFIQVSGKKKTPAKVLEQGLVQTVTSNKEDESTKYFYGFGGIIFGSLVTFLFLRQKSDSICPKRETIGCSDKKSENR